MVALAWLNGPSTPMPESIPIWLRIGPLVFDEERLQVLPGVGRQQPRRRALEADTLQILLVERPGEALDHFLHEGALRHRIHAFDVGAKLRLGAADHRLRHERLARR